MKYTLIVLYRELHRIAEKLVTEEIKTHRLWMLASENYEYISLTRINVQHSIINQHTPVLKNAFGTIRTDRSIATKSKLPLIANILCVLVSWYISVIWNLNKHNSSKLTENNTSPFTIFYREHTVYRNFSTLHTEPRTNF